MFSNRNIYMLDSTNQEGFVTDFVYCKQDTIPLMDGKDTVMMSSDSFVTYTMKAKLYEEENGKVNVNNQPDTLVMPVVKKRRTDRRVILQYFDISMNVTQHKKV